MDIAMMVPIYIPITVYNIAIFLSVPVSVGKPTFRSHCTPVIFVLVVIIILFNVFIMRIIESYIICCRFTGCRFSFMGLVSFRLMGLLRIFFFSVDIGNLIWIQCRRIHLLNVNVVLFLGRRVLV